MEHVGEVRLAPRRFAAAAGRAASVRLAARTVPAAAGRATAAPLTARTALAAAVLASGLAFAACDDSAPRPAADLGAPDGGSCPPGTLRPSQRDAHVAVFVPATREIIVHGGDAAPFDPAGMTPSVYLDETWSYDVACGAWSLLSPPSSPGRRGAHAGALDSRRGRVLVVGGRDREGGAYHLSADVWAFDVAKRTWSKLAPTGTGPKPRQGHRVAYDAARDRLLLFGGNTDTFFGNKVVGDTWELSFTGSPDGAWRSIVTAGGPSARQDVAAAIDAQRGLLVLSGGAFDFQHYSDEVWALDLATDTWRKLATTGPGPTRRFWGDLLADAPRDRLVLFGGHDDGPIGLLNDSYALSLASDGKSATWTTLLDGDSALTPAGVDHASPERRSKHALVSAGDGVAWLFGGIGDCGPLDDVWAFDLAKGRWRITLPAKVGETCARRARPGEVCDSDCGAPHP